MSEKETYQFFRMIKGDSDWLMIEEGSYDKCIQMLKSYTKSYKQGYKPIVYKIVKKGDVDLSKYTGFQFN